MELKNITEYNPEYHSGVLVWKKIDEPVGKKGKHLRSKKTYPKIRIANIKVSHPYTIDEDALKLSEKLYHETHEMIPVYLSNDLFLIGGYEQYELAKKLKLKMIPFQRSERRINDRN